MNILWDLFLTFAKIGLFTFGGGYAMISVVEHTCVERKKWITHEEMMELTVIAESTPGPIAINCATYTGYKKAGLPGALMATVGMILPSFLVIYIISLFLDNFLELTVIASAFRGIKIAVGVLILDVAVSMICKKKRKLLPKLILIASCAALLGAHFLAWNFSSVGVMLTAGFVSLAVFMVQERKGGAAA